MPDFDRYAAEQAALLRDDWQFSRLFASPSSRPGFTALLALRAELHRVAQQSGEPGIPALKFEWWRGEVERAFNGQAQHPVAQALARHHVTATGPEYCLELVDAAETEAEAAAFSRQEFRLYIYRSGGVLAEQLAQLHGLSTRHVLDAARRLGQLKRFTELTLAAGSMLRAGQWLFPVEWLPAPTDEAARWLQEPESAQALFEKLRTELDAERIATRTAMENATLPPALALQWPLAQRDHRRLHGAHISELVEESRPDNAVARLWTAWRAARRSVRSER